MSLQRWTTEPCRGEGLGKAEVSRQESQVFIMGKWKFHGRKVRGSEKHEKRAVMAARVLGKFCWLPQEGTTSVSVAWEAPDPDPQRAESAVSARPSAAKRWGNSVGRVRCGPLMNIEHWFLKMEHCDDFVAYKQLFFGDTKVRKIREICKETAQIFWCNVD